MEIDLFIPCFVDQLYPESAMNMVKVLEKAGCIVRYNPNQTCCGQPAYNAGHWNEARDVSVKFVDDFPDNRPVVNPSGSCTGYVRNMMGELFTNSSKHNDCKRLQRNIYEFSEFLLKQLKKESFGAKLEGKATYHDACGALRECGIKEGPRALLRQVAGLQLVEMNEAETCCGFGGTFAVKFEPISTAMAEQKLGNTLATEADYLISTDWSCLMHLDAMVKKRNLQVKVMHLADVLASGW